MSPRLDLRTISALEHNLADRFGSPERFGVKLPVPPGLMGEAGRVVLAIAGADGTVSSRERSTFLDILRSYGTPEAEVASLLDFEPLPGMLDHIASGEKPAFLRSLIYDAIRTARVDGFGEKERATTIRVATRLGLESGLVRAIESILVVEDACRVARHRLLGSPSDLAATGYAGPPLRAGTEARSVEYGTSMGGSMPRDLLVRYGKAVLIVAAADGEVTEPEMRWFLGHCKSIGAPDDVIEELLKFDPTYARLNEVVDERMRPHARSIVFDAVRTARGDGVSPHERALATRAAEALGLDATFVQALENQLDVEAAVREARWHLLAPIAPAAAPMR